MATSTFPNHAPSGGARLRPSSSPTQIISDDSSDADLDSLDPLGDGQPPRHHHATGNTLRPRPSSPSGEEPDDAGAMAKWAGQPAIKGSSEVARMLLLNFCTLGIVFTWGVEMTYCNPYLLSLGLSKSKTSLVWIAGPLSGLIVQPIVGAMADESRSPWGRRRPFIAGGSVIVAVALLVLGFTKEIVSFFVADVEAAKSFTIFLAVLSIYVVDFSINAVMSASRSLVVDTLPIAKQQDGAAWGGRIGSIGHLIGYGAGAVDLVALTGNFLGDTQFKKLTVIAALSILASSAVTCWAVTEKVLVAVRHDPHEPSGGLFKVFGQIWHTITHLPPRIQAICFVQFWAWIGWFPFLFYGTTWVGETYYRYDVPAEAKGADALGEMGRIGSTALVIYSCITALGSWLLPLVIRSPEDESFTPRPPQSLAAFIEEFNKYKPDLLTAWMVAHGLFACAMYMAPFATSFRFATALMCICGLPWTISMWAPPTFLGVEVNKLSGATGPGAPYERLPTGAVEMTELNGMASPRLEHGPDVAEASDKAESSGELSGIYFGILNIYTTLPQFVGTFISTIVFAILEPGKSPELATDAHPDEHHGTEGPNAIAVCMFIGALSSTMAIFATRKLKYL